ncbi:unnamed protein product [Xylocopa violacea]|uniref:CCDC92/74 N-terminal domain-containing protein n=1 Tax=Xylocopa violacea TaxID=135666 RepID=A0ABP1NKT8_XYLVO
MASKVLVKLPTVPFPQGKKSPSDIVTLTERTEDLNQNVRHQTINIDRVAQLEQNMKFLQEQHQATLVALHQEVESLSQKNRDLQFQLVFSKGSTYVPSSPSSPEDNGTGFVKPKGSPVCVNITPLQVELLEKELQDTKISLQEARTQNQYLCEIIEEQKKKLNSMEEQKTNKEPMTDEGVQVGNRLLFATSLYACRDSAEVIRRLIKQNEEQKEEIATLKAAPANTNGNKGARSRDSNNSHHSRGSPTSTSQEQTPHIFPPLQSQSYWHRRALRNRRNRHDKSDHQAEMDSSMLPQLQNDNAKDAMVFESLCYRSRGHRNYYRDESNRKYRGKVSQKDRRDSDNNHHHQHQHHNHRRDCKERSSRSHQKEFPDSAEGLREADKSAGGKS